MTVPFTISFTLCNTGGYTVIAKLEWISNCRKDVSFKLMLLIAIVLQVNLYHYINCSLLPPS